jgi:hypothetical protein
MNQDATFAAVAGEKIAVLRRDHDALANRVTASEQEIDELQAGYRVITTKQLTGMALLQFFGALIIGVVSAYIGARVAGH